MEPEYRTRSLADWTSDDVVAWLKTDYKLDDATAAVLKRESIDGYSLFELNDDLMKNDLQLSLGNRLKIKKAIASLQKQESTERTSASQSPASSRRDSTEQRSPNELAEYTPLDDAFVVQPLSKKLTESEESASGDVTLLGSRRGSDEHDIANKRFQPKPRLVYVPEIQPLQFAEPDEDESASAERDSSTKESRTFPTASGLDDAVSKFRAIPAEAQSHKEETTPANRVDDQAMDVVFEPGSKDSSPPVPTQETPTPTKPSFTAAAKTPQTTSEAQSVTPGPAAKPPERITTPTPSGEPMAIDDAPKAAESSQAKSPMGLSPTELSNDDTMPSRFRATAAGKELDGLSSKELEEAAERQKKRATKRPTRPGDGTMEKPYILSDSEDCVSLNSEDEENAVHQAPAESDEDADYVHEADGDDDDDDDGDNEDSDFDGSESHSALSRFRAAVPGHELEGMTEEDLHNAKLRDNHFYAGVSRPDDNDAGLPLYGESDSENAIVDSDLEKEMNESDVEREREARKAVELDKFFENEYKLYEEEVRMKFVKRDMHKISRGSGDEETKLLSELDRLEKQLNTAKASIRSNFKRRSKSNRRQFGASEVTLNEIFKVQYRLELIGRPVVPQFEDLSAGEPSSTQPSSPAPLTQPSDTQPPATSDASAVSPINEPTLEPLAGKRRDKTSVQSVATPLPAVPPVQLPSVQDVSPRPVAGARTSTQPWTPDQQTSVREPPSTWPPAHAQSMLVHGRPPMSLPPSSLDYSQVMPPSVLPYHTNQVGMVNFPPIARELRGLYSPSAPPGSNSYFPDTGSLLQTGSPIPGIGHPVLRPMHSATEGNMSPVASIYMAPGPLTCRTPNMSQPKITPSTQKQVETICLISDDEAEDSDAAQAQILERQTADKMRSTNSKALFTQLQHASNTICIRRPRDTNGRSREEKSPPTNSNPNEKDSNKEGSNKEGSDEKGLNEDSIEFECDKHIAPRDFAVFQHIMADFRECAAIARKLPAYADADDQVLFSEYHKMVLSQPDLGH